MTNLELLAGEPQPGERNRAILACNDYLRLGPGRSLAKLLNRYQAGAEAPPTKRLNTLKAWSGDYGWQARTVSYDTAIEAEKNEATKTRRREAMETGLALDYERVIELKLLVHYLRGEIFSINQAGQVTGFERDNVWLPDVKQIGGGEFAERVDIVRFDAAIFERYQSLLDDLARETGGRKHKSVIETPDLAPLPDILAAAIAKVYGPAQESSD